MKPCILTFTGHYLPGFKSGGPVRTLVNMVERLGDEFTYKVITGDRDLGDLEPYPQAQPNSWQVISKELVFYLSNGLASFFKLPKIIKDVNPDVVYLNSFFSFQFTIKPLLLRYLKLLPNVPFIVAPRGEFSKGAIALKKVRKNVYVRVSKILGLYKNVLWQASSEFEKKDIQRWFGSKAQIMIAPDLLQNSSASVVKQGFCAKIREKLKVVFVSRISPKKNLLMALKLLSKVEGNVLFDVYGPIEDLHYWNKCVAVIEKLPSNIVVKYCGAIPHEKIASTFSGYHLFLFPTLGENFGHVILESLLAGCPVLISDQTPWRGLEGKGIGWDFSLDQPDKFSEVLDKCVWMENDEFVKLSESARRFGLQCVNDESVVEKNRQLFENALKPTGRTCV